MKIHKKAKTTLKASFGSRRGRHYTPEASRFQKEQNSIEYLQALLWKHCSEAMFSPEDWLAEKEFIESMKTHKSIKFVNNKPVEYHPFDNYHPMTDYIEYLRKQIRTRRENVD